MAEMPTHQQLAKTHLFVPVREQPADPEFAIPKRRTSRLEGVPISDLIISG